MRILWRNACRRRNNDCDTNEFLQYPPCEEQEDYLLLLIASLFPVSHCNLCTCGVKELGSLHDLFHSSPEPPLSYDISGFNSNVYLSSKKSYCIKVVCCVLLFVKTMKHLAFQSDFLTNYCYVY